MRTIDIKKNDANQRLDKFLSKRFKTMPKSLMYKYIRTKYIKLNGKKCDIKDMLKEGKGTKMTVTSIQLDAGIPDNVFNKGNLK